MKIYCKAVVFDLWDTLFSPSLGVHPMHQIRELLVEAGAKRDEVYLEIYNSMMLKNFGENNISFNDLCKALSIPLSSKLEKDLKAVWDVGARQTILFEDVALTLNELKNHFKLGLVSNTTAYKIQHLIKSTSLDKWFDVMLFSFDLGLGKPDKAIFDLVAKKLNVLNADCVFVGDLFSVDILGSANAGMKPILIDRGHKYLEKPKEAVALIHSLNELIDLLEVSK